MGMLGMKFNETEMAETLDAQLLFADEAVEASVYATFQDTGFFASSRRIITGYAGITNRNRLIGLRCGLISSEPFSVDLSCLTKLKVKKSLFGMWQIYLEYFAGRKVRLKFSFSPKILGHKFPNQRENTDILVRRLQEFQPLGR